MRDFNPIIILLPFLPTVFSDEYFISSNILPGAQSILDIFLDTNNVGQTAEDVIAHGCWCKELDETNEDIVGGDAYDDLDRICKYWHSKRVCNTAAAGSCHSEADSDYSWLDVS